MALLLALDNALLACVPSPGGGCALQPLGAPTAASAEALVALQSGKATIIDAGAFVAATAALPPSALVEVRPSALFS